MLSKKWVKWLLVSKHKKIATSNDSLFQFYQNLI